MKLIIDGKSYTRCAAVFIADEDQKGAFKQKSRCSLGSYRDASDYASAIENWDARVLCLDWFQHPNLREPVLDEAIQPEHAKIFLVRLF